MMGIYVSFFPNIANTGRENAAHWLPVPTFRVLTSFHEARGYTFRPFLTPKFVVRIPFATGRELSFFMVFLMFAHGTCKRWGKKMRDVNHLIGSTVKAQICQTALQAHEA